MSLARGEPGGQSKTSPQRTFGHSTATDWPPAPRNVTVAVPSTFTFFTVFTLSLQKASAAWTRTAVRPRALAPPRCRTAAVG